MKPPTDPTSRHRPRYSLLTLVLVTTIVALAITVGKLYQQVAPLLAENQRLRDEFGVLTIHDPSKLHAIGVPSYPGEPRSFRVFLPEGRIYSMCYRSNDIPDRGVPEKWGSMALKPGEYFVRLDQEFFRDKVTGEPLNYDIVNVYVIHASNRQPHGSCAIPLTEAKSDWIVNEKTGHSESRFCQISRKTQVVEVDEPLVLHRTLAGLVGTSGDQDGYMVWIVAEE